VLWVSDIRPKSFDLHKTHQKSNRQTFFLFCEKQNNWQTIKVRNFTWRWTRNTVPQSTSTFNSHNDSCHFCYANGASSRSHKVTNVAVCALRT